MKIFAALLPVSLCSAFSAAPLPSTTAPRISALLFDLDGTLVDSDPRHFAAFVEMLQEEGFQDKMAEAFKELGGALGKPGATEEEEDK